MGCGAAAGLSALLRRYRKAGPAGLRGLLKSPPHLAGQASAPLRGSCVNPCRGSWPFRKSDLKLGRRPGTARS